MPKGFQRELLAALAAMASELRSEQQAPPGSDGEAAAFILRDQRARARSAARGFYPGYWNRHAGPGAPHQPEWDAGAVIVIAGATRYTVRASFECVEQLARGLARLPARHFTHPAGFTIARDRRPITGPDPAALAAERTAGEALAAQIAALPPPRPAPAPEPRKAPAKPPAPLPAPQPDPSPWPDPAAPPAPWPDPAAPPQPWAPEPDSLAARRSAAARKAMANRDRFAAARKAAATRAARAAANRAEMAAPAEPPAPAIPPAFADYVSERLGTRRWIIGPARRGERHLADRVIHPAWHAELRRAWRYATGHQGAA